MSDKERRLLELMEELLHPDNLPVLMRLMKHSQRGKMFVSRFLVSYFDEERSDELIEALAARLDLPWWVPEGLAMKLIDAQMPELALSPVVSLLVTAPDGLEPYEHVKMLNEEHP